MTPESVAITALLSRVHANDEQARDELISVLYERFHRRAQRRLHREQPGQSFGATDLMHEALLRLWRSDEFAKAATGNQLFRAFARAMRQALIDRARRRQAAKRGGDWRREPLDDLLDDVSRRSRTDVLCLNEALQAFGQEYPRQAAVLEMRFFGGCEMAESAQALGISLRTAERDCRFGLAWLRASLTDESSAC
jgi:RNA polymerase sigma factor (TIGR02999 family)